MAVKNTKKATAKPEYLNLMHAFEEATKLSVSFVTFPVIFLLFGVWLDKKFDTVPVFILSGIVLGFVIFTIEAYRAIKKIQNTK